MGATFVPVRMTPMPSAGTGTSSGSTGGMSTSKPSVDTVLSGQVLVRLSQRDPMLDWYDGDPLLKVLENQESPPRTGGQSPLRVLMLGSRQEGAGASLIGRVVQGSAQRGTECLLRPGWRRLLVQRVRDPQSSSEGSIANPGDYVDLSVMPMPDYAAVNRSADASAGPQPLPISGLKSAALWGTSAGESQQWLVELRILELEESDQPKVVASSTVTVGRGFYGMLYFGAEAVGAEIIELIEALDLLTEVRSGLPTEALPGTLTQCIVKLRRPTALDTFSGGQLGRFVLRRAGHTVGVGKVVAAAVASG